MTSGNLSRKSIPHKRQNLARESAIAPYIRPVSSLSKCQQKMAKASKIPLLVSFSAMGILPDSSNSEAIGESAMAVKLRFKRMGRSNAPFFRLSAIDSRSPRDGRVIEELGHYNPREKDKAKQFNAKLDRCKHWLDVGAIPSGTVSSLLKKAGLEHKMLRLPRPGKPKAAPAVPAAEGAAAPAAEKPAEAKA